MELWVNDIHFDDWQKYRQQLLDVTREDINYVVEKYVLKSMESDKTSKVIFGSAGDSMEAFIERGWKVERFVDELSMKSSNYEDQNDQENQ